MPPFPWADNITDPFGGRRSLPMPDIQFEAAAMPPVMNYSDPELPGTIVPPSIPMVPVPPEDEPPDLGWGNYPPDAPPRSTPPRPPTPPSPPIPVVPIQGGGDPVCAQGEFGLICVPDGCVPINWVGEAAGGTFTYNYSNKRWYFFNPDGTIIEIVMGQNGNCFGRIVGPNPEPGPITGPGDPGWTDPNLPPWAYPDPPPPGDFYPKPPPEYKGPGVPKTPTPPPPSVAKLPRIPRLGKCGSAYKLLGAGGIGLAAVIGVLVSAINWCINSVFTIESCLKAANMIVPPLLELMAAFKEFSQAFADMADLLAGFKQSCPTLNQDCKNQLDGMIGGLKSARDTCDAWHDEAKRWAGEASRYPCDQEFAHIPIPQLPYAPGTAPPWVYDPNYPKMNPLPTFWKTVAGMAGELKDNAAGALVTYNLWVDAINKFMDACPCDCGAPPPPAPPPVCPPGFHPGPSGGDGINLPVVGTACVPDGLGGWVRFKLGPPGAPTNTD